MIRAIPSAWRSRRTSVSNCAKTANMPKKAFPADVALLLAVKAKLVAVDDGIETFEEAFMAHVVMPDGRSVGDHIKPRIASAYREHQMVPLLPYRGRDG
jgi:hypothetical protein